MKRLAPILALVCAAFAPPAAAQPAPASSPLVYLHGNRGYNLDDRYGVRPEPARGRIVIRDTKTRRVTFFYTPCSVPPTFAYYHRRYLLLECPGPDFHYEVLNVVSLVATRVPNVPTGPNGVSLAQPGGQWVFGSTREGGPDTSVYINWHTGERRDDPTPPGARVRSRPRRPGSRAA